MVIGCFEKKTIWGCVMLIFIFLLPGMVGARDVWFGCGRNYRSTMMWLSGPVFPLLVIGAKLVALVN